MVVALMALRVINRVGKVQRKVSAHNGELARVLGPVGCFHQNSLYQLLDLKRHGYVSSMSSFAGNSRHRAGPLATAIVCVSQFMVILDVTIVVIALPAIRDGLEFSDADLQWVFTAYTLVFGGLLICGGRLADVAGRRRIFLIGLGLFSAASAGCTLAGSPEALVALRVLQGAGAALLSPAALALLTTLSEPGEARRRAVGWWTAVAAAGGASGWVIGGLITQYAGWPGVFAVNVAIGLVVLAIALLVLPADKKSTERRRLDLGGALTVTAGLALLVYGLTSAGDRGLARLSSWLPLLLATVAFVIFLRHEERTADPLLPLRLLRSLPVAGANLTALAITASTSSAMYLAVMYVQGVLGVPAGQASLLFPAVNLAAIAGALLTPPLLGRLGARRSLLAGFATIAAGITFLVALPPQGLPVVQLLAAFAFIGTGIGTASVASTQTGTDAVDPAYRGVAAGVLNSAAQVGTAVGVALLTPLTSTATGSAVTAGYRIGFAGAGLIALAGALSSFLVPQSVLMTCSRSEAVASPDREQVQDQRLLGAQCVHRKARTTSSAEASANSPISDSRTASTESRSADPSASRSTGSAASASVDSRRVVGNCRMPRRSSSSGASAAGSTSTGSGRRLPAATPSKPAANRPASSK
jgi:MFS family permease